MPRLIPKTDITAEECRELFTYDAERGRLIWKKPGRGKRVGMPAGGLHKRTTSYRQVCIRYKKYSEHRLIWLYVKGVWPKDDLDHRDRNRQNNQFENLREASLQLNGANRSLNSNNTSGFKGVHWARGWKKWVAMIFVNGKTISLGGFTRKEDAAAAYAQAAKHYFGEFAAP